MNLRHPHFWMLSILTVTLFFATVTTAPHLEPSPQLQVEATLLAQPVPQDHHRSKRAFGDFFAKVWTVASLGKAQYDDTRTTLAKIYEILRDQFSDTVVIKTVGGGSLIIS